MCYCYGYGYGFNNNWMAAAWGLNMLSQALGNITNRNNNSTNTQSSRRNVSSGGMTSPSIFGSSNRVGDLLSNPTQNIGTSRSSGYDPFTNPNPSKYNDLSRFYNDNLAPLSDPMFYMDMDNSNLGSFYNGSMTGNSGLGDLNPGGLSSMDTSGLAPLGEMYQYLMSQNPVSAQPQSQAQAQTHSHQSVQSQAQPQPQAQSQTQAASTQTQQATQLQTQQSSQASGQTSGALSNVTTSYSGSAADLDAKLGGVLTGKGQVFLNAQQQYGINAAVLASMCMHESANGTSSLARTKNNVGGVRIAGSTEFRSYASVDDCIMHIAKFLKSSYINKGLTTIAQIGAKYCPTNDPTDRAGLNSGWGAGVTRWYNQSFV